MKTAAATSFIVLVLFFSSVSQCLNVASGQNQNMNYVIKMSVTYSNQSSENQIWNFTEEDRTISLFMNNTWQTVQLANSSFTIEDEKNDTDGNPVAVLRFPEMQLSAGGNLTFTTAYHVVSKPRLLLPITEEGSGVLQNISKDLRDKYTREEGSWLISNSTLQNLAQSIVGNETKVLTIVRKLVSWIHTNIIYTETHEVPLYANQTLTESLGDCDDQAILLITLSRILGIPAYLQIGAVYLPTRKNETSTYWEDHVKGLAKRIGWHGWAMVYVPPWGWLPVDLTFVWGGFTDPLKAITNAAVTSQSVIQYVNISKYDYVASSRQAKDFLINNDFCVYMEDEMTAETGPQGSFGEGYLEWLTVGLIAAVVILVASSLLVSRRLKRLREEETPKTHQ